MSRETQPACRATGCRVIPRKDPVYCAKHRWMHDVDKARHEGRAAVWAERATAAEARGRQWVAFGAPAMASCRQLLAEIESNADRSAEGAAGAWRAVSALNANISDAQDLIIGTVAERHGADTYADSLGTEWKVSQGKGRPKWDTTRVMDTIDRLVSSHASPAAYVSEMRRLTTGPFRPWRLRSILGGDLSRGFQDVHDGPNGLRPLSPETDAELDDEYRRGEWADVWCLERETRRPGVPSVDADGPVSEHMDVLRDLAEARLLTQGVIKDWAARAVYGRRPGDLVHDLFGAPVGKVTSGIEVRGPVHAVINEAIAQIGDRASIRAAYVDVCHVAGSVRELGKHEADGVDIDDLRTIEPGRWSAKVAA